MLKNYMIVAFRIVLRSKLFSLINVIGLSLGLASCVLIGYYIQQELTYDRWHPNVDRIYRIATNFLTSNGGDRISASPDRLAVQFKAEFPEIEGFCRINPFNDHTVRSNGEKIIEKGFATADARILKMFQYEFLEGDAATALANPDNVVISETIARKYFGTIYAVAKTLEIDDKLYTVTGVYKDLPSNTSLPRHALMGFNFTESLDARWMFNCKTYVLVSEKFDRTAFDEKLKAFTKKHFQDFEVAFELAPLKDLHFSSGVKFDGEKGNKNYLLGFAFAGVVLLLVVTFNYINLSVLLLIRRAKEIGMRKISGARTHHLITQFLTESILLLVISGMFAFGFIQLILPTFTLVTHKTIDFTWNSDYLILLGLLIFFIALVLVMLIYPGSMLGRIRPTTMLKGDFQMRSSRLRNFLTTIQFGLCTAILLSLEIIILQMQFVHDKPLGYDRENLTVLRLPSDSLSQTKLNVLSNQLATAGFQEYSFATYAASLFETDPIHETVTVPVSGEDIKLQANIKLADANFVDVMKMQITAGRQFKNHSSSTWSDLVMVNETFAREAGWKDPVGREIKLPFFKNKLKVIGVIKDFHFASLHNPIEPMILQAKDFSGNVYSPDNDVASLLYLKASPENLPAIKKTYKAIFPDAVFDYSFLDDTFEAQYILERNTISLLLYFAILSLIATSLGLYSIAAYQAEIRTKEIGIRKILGANLQSLFMVLSKNNFLCILTGAAFGAIIAWKASNLWLDNFVYKVQLYLPLLVIPLVFVLTFSGVVIIYSVFRVASANPAQSLRSE